MSPCKSWRTSFAATWEEIAGAAQWLNEVMAGQGLPDKTVYAAQLCLEELLSNIFRHGGGLSAPQSPPLRVTVAVTIDGAGLRMTVEDNGKPFDVTAAPAHGIEKPLADIDPGGLGIHLIRGFAASVAHERAGLGNRVTVALPRQ